ncbi:MAG: hypothetical protein AB1485_02565 [Candidatus Thermoplasmatota archaeon]
MERNRNDILPECVGYYGYRLTWCRWCPEAELCKRCSITSEYRETVEREEVEYLSEDENQS